jgi:hypothetical protein
MALILLGRHPVTGEAWWYHTEPRLHPFTPEEMDLKKAMDIDIRERQYAEALNNSFTWERGGDGVALSSTSHPNTCGIRLHAWAPWYKRFWWWLTGQIHLNPAHLETVEIEVEHNENGAPVSNLRIRPRE